MYKLIDKLSKEKREVFDKEYEEGKREMSTAWVLRFFQCHYLHTKQWLLWILFMVANFLVIGIVRWIIQALVLKANIESYNDKLSLEIYSKLK